MFLWLVHPEQLLVAHLVEICVRESASEPVSLSGVVAEFCVLMFATMTSAPNHLSIYSICAQHSLNCHSAALRLSSANWAMLLCPHLHIISLV